MHTTETRCMWTHSKPRFSVARVTNVRFVAEGITAAITGLSNAARQPPQPCDDLTHYAEGLMRLVDRATSSSRKHSTSTKHHDSSHQPTFLLPTPRHPHPSWTITARQEQTCCPSTVASRRTLASSPSRELPTRRYVIMRHLSCGPILTFPDHRGRHPAEPQASSRQEGASL